MKTLGFGAILWDDIRDNNPATDSDSVSGESNIGGAVFNVIVHLQKLGHDAYMLSAIGDDPLGEKTFREIDRLNVHRDFVGKSEAPTCVIRVTFDDEGFPHYSSPDVVSWDQITITKEQITKMKELEFDFFVFGTLEQRNAISRNSLHAVLDNVRFRNVFIDLTLRGGFYDREILDYSMRRANILKMNDDEALEVNRLFGFGHTDISDLIPLISKEFDSDVVCITVGSKGAYIGDRSGTIYRPGYEVTVNDTVGSGDAFSAGLLYMLGKGESVDKACEFGNKMGALVSSKKSSIPEYEVSDLEPLS